MFHYMYKLHFVYPFICPDTWIAWSFGYCEYDIFKQLHKIHSLSYLTVINTKLFAIINNASFYN